MLKSLFRLTVFVLLFAQSQHFVAQMMLNSRGQVWTQDPFFNDSYIRKHGIKSIQGRYSYKRPGTAIEETNFRHVFMFDSLGRISQVYETNLDDGTTDTIIQKYYYNNLGKLICFSSGTNMMYTFQTFFYDENGFLTTTEFYNQVKYVDGDVKTLLLRKEFYEYQIEGIDTCRITKNSYNLPFKRERKIYNMNGQLIQVDERFLTNSLGKTDYFEFNNQGLLENKSTQTTSEPFPKNVWTFTYDRMGNVQEKKELNNTVLKKEIQFIHNEESGKLTAILEREISSETITIIRFQDYQYYDRN